MSEKTNTRIISADVYARVEYNAHIEIEVSDQATEEEIQQELDEAAKLAVSENIQTYQGLQPDITITRLEEKGNNHDEPVESLPLDDGEELSLHSLGDTNTTNPLLQNLDVPSELMQPDGFPITSETLRQLPSFVAAVVSDYSTHEEAQRWFLHDIQFDLQGLDALPIDEGSTCEIWTQGWVWRGRKGTISLSPLMVQPQSPEVEEVFAWAVERENTGMQHIQVWRIRCLETQPPDTPVRAQIASEALPQPLKQQAGGEKEGVQANNQGNDEALLAFVCPDDCPGVSFNVIPWLQKADDAAIETLREISYESSYFCDQVAQDVRDDDALVEAVMAYCEATNRGFSCALPIQATEEWIRHNRPSLAKPILGIQDAG